MALERLEVLTCWTTTRGCPTISWGMGCLKANIEIMKGAAVYQL